MSYQDKYKNAKAALATSNIKPEHLKLENIGEMFIGRFISKTLFRFNLTKKDAMRYLFDTDKGPITWSPGPAFDGSQGGLMQEGEIYAVTYTGDKDVGQVNEMHEYTVEHVPSDVADEPSGNLPFNPKKSD